MATFAWPDLLRRWSADLLSSPLAQRMAYLIPPAARAAGWLGAPGATEQQLRDAEARLGTSLPPAYRAFLETTNGWSLTTHASGHLWPAEQVDWLRARHPELIRTLTAFGEEDQPDAEYLVYGPAQDHWRWRTRYLRGALEVSDPYHLDGDCYLLNPAVVTAEGEWEAWALNAERCKRYRSFWDLMQAEYQQFLDMKNI